MMNPATIKKTLPAIVPFIHTVGLALDEVELGRATATLASRPEVHNHIGTVHTGAVYTLGESASGAVVLSLFGDLLPGVFIALKTARIDHRRAIAGDVLATAVLQGDPATIRSTYEQTGKVDFDVDVALTVDGGLSAEVVYTWAVRAPR